MISRTTTAMAHPSGGFAGPPITARATRRPSSVARSAAAGAHGLRGRRFVCTAGASSLAPDAGGPESCGPWRASSVRDACSISDPRARVDDHDFVAGEARRDLGSKRAAVAGLDAPRDGTAALDDEHAPPRTR